MVPGGVKGGGGGLLVISRARTRTHLHLRAHAHALETHLSWSWGARLFLSYWGVGGELLLWAGAGWGSGWLLW